MDLTPIQSTIELFNRTVLEKLSPADESAPLFRKLRDPGLAMTGEEIRSRVRDEQDALVLWLEQTFFKLAQGISRSKEIGIYSTSILWGGLIIALETVIGGGISILEAVVDSAVAPFVTKGVVELFAYQEIQRVARELASRYRSGLVSIIRVQGDRYEDCLKSLTTTDETIQRLERLKAGYTD